MNGAWAFSGILLLLFAAVALEVVRRPDRFVHAPQPEVEEHNTEQGSHVDWDDELDRLLRECGYYVEPAFVPVSDEELLDLADVVGVVTTGAVDR